MKPDPIPKAGPQNDALCIELGRQARSVRQERGLSIRAAAEHLRCSPRFVHQLEQGKPTARMDKVQQALAGLGLQLSVHTAQAGRAQAPHAAQVEARAKQSLYEEKLARAHDRIAARLALEAIDSADLERARSQVRKWSEERICSRWYIDRWSRILSGSGSEIAAKLLALGKDDAKALFQNTPFGFLVRAILRA